MESKAIQKYEAQGAALVEQAGAIRITDDESRLAATEFTAQARKAIKAIDAEFKPDIQSAHELHKSLLDRSKRLQAPFKEAQRIVDAEIKRDYLEQERIRREEERAAREKAEAERRAQEAQQQATVDELIEAGDVDGAEALLQSEVVTAPTVPIETVDKTVRSTAGSTTVRKDINVTVVDKMAVVRAVATGQLPETLVDVNLGMAKRYAKAGGLTSMPGFRVVEDAIVSGRG